MKIWADNWKWERPMSPGSRKNPLGKAVRQHRKIDISIDSRAALLLRFLHLRPIRRLFCYISPLTSSFHSWFVHWLLPPVILFPPALSTIFFQPGFSLCSFYYSIFLVLLALLLLQYCWDYIWETIASASTEISPRFSGFHSSFRTEYPSGERERERMRRWNVNFWSLLWTLKVLYSVPNGKLPNEWTFVFKRETVTNCPRLMCAVLFFFFIESSFRHCCVEKEKCWWCEN